MLKEPRTRRLILSAVAAGLLARALFAFAYWQDRPLTIDQVEYLLLADQLLAGEGLTFPQGERRLMRSPGYPIFLAAMGSLAPGQAPVKFAQCLLGAFAIFLVAAMAYRLDSSRAAAIAAWVAALYPPLVFQPAYMLSEPLYTVLALGCVLTAWRAVEAGESTSRMRDAAITGLLGGLVLLVRPEFALFLGLFGLLLLWRRHVAAAATAALVAAVVVAPWPAYNLLAHDRVIFFSSRGGPNFWMGNNPLALGDGDVSSNPPMAHEYVMLMEENAALSAEQLERVFYERGFEFIREHPGQWLTLLSKKVFWFVVPFGPSYQSRSALFFASQAASWIALLAATVLAWPCVRRVRPVPVVLVFAAVTVFVTSLVFFPLERYRVPLLDPVLIACVGTLAGRRQHATNRPAR